MVDAASLDHSELANGAARLGIPLGGDVLEAMFEYLALLQRWNRRFNLTAVRDPQRMVREHLLDSLSIHPYVAGTRVIDIGTGAGLPGIVLALVAPERQFVLLDGNGKKTRFVREAVRVLSMSNVQVEHCRTEDYRPGAGFDTVVCRAFAPLPRLLAAAGHLCAADGIILAQKGRFPDKEIAEVPDGWSHTSTELTVPGLTKARHLITLRPQHAS